MKIKVRSKEHEKAEIKINTEFIRLDSLLKFEGLAETGGHAKLMIQDGLVRVNGEAVTARGKKIKPGDTVSFRGVDYKILSEL